MLPCALLGRDHLKSGEDSLAISFRNCNQFCLFEGEGVVGEMEFQTRSLPCRENVSPQEKRENCGLDLQDI